MQLLCKRLGWWGKRCAAAHRGGADQQLPGATGDGAGCDADAGVGAAIGRRYKVVVDLVIVDQHGCRARALRALGLIAARYRISWLAQFTSFGSPGLHFAGPGHLHAMTPPEAREHHQCQCNMCSCNPGAAGCRGRTCLPLRTHACRQHASHKCVWDGSRATGTLKKAQAPVRQGCCWNT